MNVRADYADRGIDRKMVQWSVDNAHREVFLHVRVSDVASQNAYSAMGFTRIQQVKDFFDVMSNGDHIYEDAYYMMHPGSEAPPLLEVPATT